MNNSKVFLNRFLRGHNQEKILRHLRRQDATFDQYLSRNRFPNFPKIVVYCNQQSASKYLENILPLFKYITPSVVEGDYEMSKKVAKQVLVSNSQAGINGVFIQGFPYNATQALHLDQCLGGVNLAIYLNGGQRYRSSVTEMLNYYHERGSLYQINDYKNTDFDHLASIRRDITENIKLSE